MYVDLKLDLITSTERRWSSSSHMTVTLSRKEEYSDCSDEGGGRREEEEGDIPGQVRLAVCHVTASLLSFLLF